MVWQRRDRERAALRRLEQLVDGDGVVEQPPPAGRLKRVRLSVLEESAARIEWLERLLSQADMARRRAEAQAQLLSEQVSGMVASERQGLQWLDNTRTLASSSSLGDRIAHTLKDCRSGQLLDANDCFFEVTGLSPEDVLQRWTYPSPASHHDASGDCPHSLSHSGSGSGSWPRRVHSESTVGSCRQYPRSQRLLQELLAGQRDSFRAQFRCCFSDGHVYEFASNVWVVDSEWMEEADGSGWQCR